MMDELVSVIVPVYNVEKYLKKCVNSIINQTYKNLEIILVDDGSPDKSAFICEEFAKIDSRIKVIHKENGGLSDARNAGIEASTGKYLMFVDADDYIAAEMCEKLLAALQQNNADLSICNFLYVGEDLLETYEKMNGNMPIRSELLTGRDVIERKIMEEQNWYWIVAWNKLYSRKLFDSVRFVKGKLHEDEFIFHIILLQCKAIACIADPLYYYVQRNGSIMNSEFSLQRLDKCEALLRRTDGLIKAGCSPESIYRAASEGMGHLNQMFERGLMNNESFHKRYTDLVAIYRGIGLFHILGSVDSIKHKTCLLMNYVSPYYFWKLKKIIRRSK